MLLPAADGDARASPPATGKRVAIARLASDPAFMDGDDSVVLLAEVAQRVIHPRGGRLPQMLGVEVRTPSTTTVRRFYLDRFTQDRSVEIPYSFQFARSSAIDGRRCTPGGSNNVAAAHTQQNPLCRAK